MRTRASMKKVPINYKHEEERHMCEGCDKTIVPGVCFMFKEIPGMYRRANECPRNPRKRRSVGSKVRVGQQKQGGNK